MYYLFIYLFFLVGMSWNLPLSEKNSIILVICMDYSISRFSFYDITMWYINLSRCDMILMYLFDIFDLLDILNILNILNILANLIELHLISSYKNLFWSLEWWCLRREDKKSGYGSRKELQAWINFLYFYQAPQICESVDLGGCCCSHNYSN